MGREAKKADRSSVSSNLSRPFSNARSLAVESGAPSV